MLFTSGCNHPSFSLPWRTLLAHLVALHLLHLGSAQLTVVAPDLRVTANVGQDVVLRCQLSPCKNAWSSDIRWIQHRSSDLVHHYQNGVDLDQMEEYKGRTELLRDGLSDGNLDLRITAVSSSDSGSYICAVQDGDGYAEAVVELEVSDPFSQITHPWKVALAVVITLLVGSFVVTIVFLHRKQVKKDAMLKEQAEISNLHATELKKQAERLDISAAELKEQARKVVERTEELEKQNSQLNHHHEGMDLTAANLKKLGEKLDSSAADLKEQVAKLVEQTKEVEKENAVFKEKVEQMGLRTPDLEKQAAESEERTEEGEVQKPLLDTACEQMAERTEESEKPAEELDSEMNCASQEPQSSAS